MRRAGSAILIGLLAPAGLLAQQRIQLPARDQFLPGQPAVLYTLGKEDGEEWEILSGVRAVAFDGRDNLYVLDGASFRVLVFDASGKFIRRISQRGDGPGELMTPTGMTVMTDGTVVVSDGGRRAYSLFKSDGSFVKNVPFGDADGGSGGRTSFAATADFTLEGLFAHPRGGIVAQIFPRRIGRGDPSASTGQRKVPVKWIDVAGPGSMRAVLYELTLPSITPKVQENTGRGVMVTTQPPYWTPANTIGVLPTGGVAIAHEAEYRIKLVSPAGRVERIIERGIAPRRGTAADKEAFVKRQRENFAQGGLQMSRTGGTTGGNSDAGAALEQMLRSATWLDVIPALRRINTDPLGRIWVARTPSDFGSTGAVDLLRSDGGYIGTIANAVLPAAVSGSGRAAFIERDELGVEHVTVKRLPSTWR